MTVTYFLHDNNHIVFVVQTKGQMLKTKKTSTHSETNKFCYFYLFDNFCSRSYKNNKKLFLCTLLTAAGYVITAVQYDN